MFLYTIQQNSKQFPVKSTLFQYPATSKKVRALHLNTGRVRERPLSAGGLKGTLRHQPFLSNISHIAYITDGEYC